MYSPHPPNQSQKDSDAILLSLLKHRQNLTPVLAESPIQTKGKSPDNHGIPLNKKDMSEVTEQEIWDKLGKSYILNREINHKYGEDAKNKAYRDYRKHVDIDPSPHHTPIIQDIVETRNKERSYQATQREQELRELINVRNQLIEQSERIKEMKNERRPTSSCVVSPLSFVDPVSRQPQWTAATPWAPSRESYRSTDSAVDIQNMLHDFQYTIPAQQTRLEKLKRDFGAEYRRLHEPYRGELGPQSYHSWQMEDYYIVRAVVDDLVDQFLDSHFRAPPQTKDPRIAQALYDADTRLREDRKLAILQNRAIQLIMEELVLETTSDMTEEVGLEMRNILAFMQNDTDMFFMTTAEEWSLGEEGGRNMEDPAYNLVTKGFFNLHKDRAAKRSDVWAHSQHMHLHGKTDDDADEYDPDATVIDFHELTPLDLKQTTPLTSDPWQVKLSKQRYQEYQRDEIEYWQGMSPTISTLEVASKCKAISVVKPSFNNRLLAVGTVHGDIYIYDVGHMPLRPLRALSNITNMSDPVQEFAWSMDNMNIISINEMGTLRVWSLQSPGIEKKEVKGLDLKPDTQGVIAEQLTMTLALDVDKWDFKFQSGPFAEQSGGAPAGPSTAAFYPSLSVFGTQNSLAIALDNNDILKCNTEEPFYETPSPDQEEDFKETPKIIHQNLRGTDNNSIGENIPAELFRDHKHPVLLLGFIDNVKNMVSVDNKGHIYIWRYTRREISSYEWFQPYKKYRLDMSKTMYTPATNSKPTVIFSDKTQTGKRHKTKQQIFKDREATENSIAHLNLKDPFHIDMIPEQEMATHIYAPDEHVSEAGSVFHIIIRRLHSNQLSSYLTRAYRPVKIKCERLVSCLQTPDGSELVFVLLFPEYPPKEAHLTVVRVDLKTMKVLDCRLDIMIEDDDQYLRCLRDDVVSCAVTRTLGATGAPYLCVNIEGNISFYSLVTGQEVVTTQRQNEIFNGLTVNLQSSPISAKTEVTVADYDGMMFVFFYTSDQKEKKLCRKLTVLELEDENPEEIRENMRVTFNTWNEHPPAQPLSKTIMDVTYDTDTLHPAAYARGLIMELVDDMIQRRDGPYTEEMLELFGEMDAVRNYTALGPEYAYKQIRNVNLD